MSNRLMNPGLFLRNCGRNFGMPLEFHNKRAIVTGGANGIGLATARLLWSYGADVHLFDLGRENPQEVAAAFGATGHVADVTDFDRLDAVFDELGVPDVVVANAGIVQWAPMSETTSEQWDRTIAVNLTGIYNTVQVAARRMKLSRKGAIVITASTNSYDGEAGLIAYNAAKAGLLGILHTAANELGPYQIRVNAVCPGLIRTRITREEFYDNRVRMKEYFRHIPLGRGGEPEEVAAAIAFLASDLASFITGAALLVDGGQMAAKFGTWSDNEAEFLLDRWKLR